VDKHEVCAAAVMPVSSAAIPLNVPCGRIIAGPSYDQHVVGLPDAALRPGRGLQVRLVDHEVILGLQLLHPSEEAEVAGSSSAACAIPAVEANSAATTRCSGGSPCPCKTARRAVSGELARGTCCPAGTRAMVTAVLRRGVGCAPAGVHDGRQYRHGDSGIHPVDLVETGLCETHEITVAYGADSGRPLLSRKDGHLAHDLPAEDGADGLFLPEASRETTCRMPCTRKYKQSAASPRRKAPLPGQVHPFEAGLDELVLIAVDLPK